ncbi:rho GTPase-activating protein 7-like isoform 2 [Cricetulus griseus]|uniref:Rho GTPase-activating protein 7-like isoform 2 n=1 Tax=Cricetulus griseus TaxID=10029 RepID=A0A061I482_CRIGR|nr:rho GTPase-activating protein 7-like isoform 2 [Cricetulus griseus]
MSSPRGAVYAPLRRSLSEQLRDSTARAWDLLWRNFRERRLAVGQFRKLIIAHLRFPARVPRNRNVSPALEHPVSLGTFPWRWKVLSLEEIVMHRVKEELCEPKCHCEKPCFM